MQPAIMVMGVSGCGKSTIGAALANSCGGVFLDGDDFHPQINVDHMASGKPLTDAMRWPWLDALAAAVNASRAEDVTIFACSALKKTYRDYLRAKVANLAIVYLDAPREVIAERLEKRSHHFMPLSLLDSQYKTLEVPRNVSLIVSVDQPVEDILTALGIFVRGNFKGLHGGL